jgi:hydroxymethylpyrimidine/phosphomethylpyrimidine kinase
MLGTTETIEAVASSLDLLAPQTPVVLDPVMVSESGAQLLEPTARGALIERLIGRVTVVTPNLPEARALLGLESGRSRSGGDVDELARAIHALGAGAVVITGGHREQLIDVFYDGTQLVEIAGERHPDGATHGSGCTHSSVLAARLARGDTPLEAARVAKRMAAAAVRDGLAGVGAGPGPVDVLGVGTLPGPPDALGIGGLRREPDRLTR